MKMRKECRLWWPVDLSSVEPTSCHFLFGWIFQSSSNSVDIVVAVAVKNEAISLIQPSLLQRIVHDTNGSMSSSLQDRCTFSLLGQYAAEINGNCQLTKMGSEECYHDDHSRSVSPEKSSWIQLGCCPCNYTIKGPGWLPKLHSMHLDGIDTSHIHLHVCYALCYSYIW